MTVHNNPPITSSTYADAIVTVPHTPLTPPANAGPFILLLNQTTPPRTQQQQERATAVPNAPRHDRRRPAQAVEVETEDEEEMPPTNPELVRMHGAAMREAFEFIFVNELRNNRNQQQQY